MKDFTLRFLRKIHNGADDTCYASILTDWKNSKMKEDKLAQELFDLICDLSEKAAGEALGISQEEACQLLNEYRARYCNDYHNTFYDRSFTPDEFYDHCENLIATKQSEAYFSINSFYKRKRLNDNVRHLNAFVLDFDYYKITEYEDMEPLYFYEKVLEKHLKMPPTAVIDSGRGLYVIYAFHHCSYHMNSLYHAVLKYFFKEFERYGMDPAAMLTTQVIRIPGTLNSKTNRMVSILKFNDTDYKIQDFTQLLPWKQAEVKEYRKEKLRTQKKKQKHCTNGKSLERRKPHFKQYYDDFKKLILIRNKSEKYSEEGYREQLLYLMREKACWMGYSIDESVKMAMKLNELFNVPLAKEEVEYRCRPSPNRAACSIDTTIDKLAITMDEQKQLKVLRRRHIKKRLYAKRKRCLPMLNRTKTQQRILERRTRVCELKNVEHLKNTEIADILEVDKSTITRDLQYIKTNPAKFIQKIKDYMNAIEASKLTDEFTRKLIFKRQKQLLEWLKIGHTALDFMVRQMGVAKN